MYTDGAIYYVLYYDRVLKYLKEITRKPEKLAVSCDSSSVKV